MIALIPMAGTMTSFGGIKSAIQADQNCTRYDNDKIPEEYTTTGKLNAIY